ncbi:hypothetical protein ABZ646_19005 [Streptomyces sp. NPDC007162]|uniref:hypothetical protein n=1 Tax=Streptomyces sp. NPDC007162 TaxID=3156917 RepID=UPI0033F8E9D1
MNSANGRDFWAPEFGADIVTFTLGAQQKLYGKAKDDPAPLPDQASLDQAKKVLDTSNLGHSSANDVATFLRFGGFATKAPEPDSLEFRTGVEALKQAWAACDSDNPIDHYRVLTGVVTVA